MAPSVLAIGLSEAIKYMRKKIRADALAGIADGDLRMRIVTLKPNLDAPVFRRKLNRVGEQIPNDLLEAGRVTHHRAGGRIKLSAKLNRLGLGGRPRGLERGLDHCDQVHLLV